MVSVTQSQKGPPTPSRFLSTLLRKFTAFLKRQQKVVLASHYRLEFKDIKDAKKKK